MTYNSLKEKEILEAARGRFAHYGYSKVTMEEIASDVEMGKASLYYYFPTKEELFKSVIKKEQDLFVEEIENLLKQDFSASEKLKYYVIKRVEYFQQLVNLGTLNLHSVLDIKSVFKELLKVFETQEIFLIQKIIEEGKIKGEFDPGVNEKTNCLFIHLLQGLRLQTLRSIKGNRLENEHYESLKEEMMLFVDIFSKGIKV
jgi:TetR/AcrR family transcriptional repressor of mexJK operon